MRFPLPPSPQNRSDYRSYEQNLLDQTNGSVHEETKLTGSSRSSEPQARHQQPVYSSWSIDIDLDQFEVDEPWTQSEDDGEALDEEETEDQSLNQLFPKFIIPHPLPTFQLPKSRNPSPTSSSTNKSNEVTSLMDHHSHPLDPSSDPQLNPVEGTKTNKWVSENQTSSYSPSSQVIKDPLPALRLQIPLPTSPTHLISSVDLEAFDEAPQTPLSASTICSSSEFFESFQDFIPESELHSSQPDQHHHQQQPEEEEVEEVEEEEVPIEINQDISIKFNPSIDRNSSSSDTTRCDHQEGIDQLMYKKTFDEHDTLEIDFQSKSIHLSQEESFEVVEPFQVFETFEVHPTYQAITPSDLGPYQAIESSGVGEPVEMDVGVVRYDHELGEMKSKEDVNLSSALRSPSHQPTRPSLLDHPRLPSRTRRTPLRNSSLDHFNIAQAYAPPPPPPLASLPKIPRSSSSRPRTAQLPISSPIPFITDQAVLHHSPDIDPQTVTSRVSLRGHKPLKVLRSNRRPLTAPRSSELASSSLPQSNTQLMESLPEHSARAFIPPPTHLHAPSNLYQADRSTRSSPPPPPPIRRSASGGHLVAFPESKPKPISIPPPQSRSRTLSSRPQTANAEVLPYSGIGSSPRLHRQVTMLNLHDPQPMPNHESNTHDSHRLKHVILSNPLFRKLSRTVPPPSPSSSSSSFIHQPIIKPIQPRGGQTSIDPLSSPLSSNPDLSHSKLSTSNRIRSLKLSLSNSDRPQLASSASSLTASALTPSNPSKSFTSSPSINSFSKLSASPSSSKLSHLNFDLLDSTHDQLRIPN